MRGLRDSCSRKIRRGDYVDVFVLTKDAKKDFKAATAKKGIGAEAFRTFDNWLAGFWVFAACYLEDRPDEHMNVIRYLHLVHDMQRTLAGDEWRRIKGETLFDISIGSIVHQLFDITDYFKEIVILKLRESCIMELPKWVNTRTGAFSWTHACKALTELGGISDPEEVQEEKLKETIKRIVKIDFSKENLTDPEVLPPADCILTVWVLDVISHDKQDYISNLRKMSKLLKHGGHLIIIGSINITYFTAGNERLYALNYDECFVKKTLTDEGYEIESCELLDRKVESDLVDYKKFMVLTAVKGNIKVV
ncbi:nicotinamide N-methyltransferase-like [Pseudophryne corroboree]|uniref:nicotinamide N-methyltransferase-like n=1 Tax=Pseudophryne corroboree TaxID=495146 RepID=UPI003081327A